MATRLPGFCRHLSRLSSLAAARSRLSNTREGKSDYLGTVRRLQDVDFRLQIMCASAACCFYVCEGRVDVFPVEGPFFVVKGIQNQQRVAAGGSILI